MKSSVFLISAYIVFLSFGQVGTSNSQTLSANYSQNSELKLSALDVLRKRCNTCHRIRNPRRVFSLNNMDAFALRIHKQVFVYKRMPKGKKRRKKMTEEEFLTLKNWLKETLPNNQ